MHKEVVTTHTHKKSMFDTEIGEQAEVQIQVGLEDSHIRYFTLTITLHSGHEICTCFTKIPKSHSSSQRIIY